MRNRITLIIIGLFILNSCERPDPIPSALRLNIEYLNYNSSEQAISTIFYLNFKPNTFKIKWFQGSTLIYEDLLKNVRFEGLDSFKTSLIDLKVSLPAKLRCEIEVLTLGNASIEVSSKPINIGFLEQTPFGNTPGLLAFWPLLEDYEDYTTNQHHMNPMGVLEHKVIPNTPYKGCYFTNNAYLFSDHDKRLNPKNVSIAAFVYLNDLNDPADLHTLVSKREYNGWGNSFDFKVSKGVTSVYKVSVSWNLNVKNNEFESTENLSFKKAAHIVYTHDDKYIRIWVNGSKIDERPSEGSLENTNNLPVCIGTRPGVRHSLKNAFLRDVAIWNRALSDKEIKEIASLYL